MFLTSILSFYFFFSVVYNKFMLIVMADGQNIVPLGLQALQLVHYGSKVTLLCKYKLGTARLHSVKWYKDDHHFYSFTQQLKPQVKFFPLKHIQFDESNSDMYRASLYNVTSEFSGNYRCEVTTENPKNSIVKKANVAVFAYPDRDPIIQFKKLNSNSNEEIMANCTSGKTIPPSTIFWFINGLKIDKKLVVKEEIKAVGGYFRISSTIKFTMEKDLEQLILGCVASILNSLPVTRTSVSIPISKPGKNHSVKLLNGSNNVLSIYIFWTLIQNQLFR